MRKNKQKINRLDNKQNYKKDIFITFFLCVAIFFTYQYIAKAQNSSQLISIENINDVGKVGTETLEVLLRLQSLSFDDSIFRDKAFIELIDYSIELKEKPTGRNNPFAPINLNETYIRNEVIEVADSISDEPDVPIIDDSLPDDTSSVLPLSF